VSDFDGFVKRVIGGIQAVDHLLRTVNREIAVQFDHGVAGVHELGTVHLNFVIILGGGCSREEEHAKSRGKNQERAEARH
jgi:hypothetical protein